MDSITHRKGAYETFLYSNSIDRSEIEIILVTRYIYL